jgi:cellulose synthase/poly-beta-1,6-N-acetylglucosamine synthase-like glycosyltransferase/peptidoglycan/xylan/chitin deacetylase (PgdA/CDA1 family)/spore germination protein YaaH
LDPPSVAWDEDGSTFMAQPVFYDPRQARWKRLRPLFDLLGISVTLIVIFFVFAALRSQPLPELTWPAQTKPYHALKEKEKEKAKEKRKLAIRRTHRKSQSAPSLVKLNASEGIRAAFYVPWDAASFSSLREYARQIDLLFPEWLSVLTSDGHLQSVDPLTNKFFNVIQNDEVHPVDDKVMPFLKSEGTGMEVFPLVNNFDGADWVDISDFLNDPDARQTFRDQVDDLLDSDKYRGLMVDFETFPKKGQPGFLALLNELSGDLHAKGMKLYVTVPSHNDEWNYAAVAAAADGVVLMNYDEHYPGGTPGPVASQDWFVDNLRLAEKSVPQDKLICAIANFGYDFAQKPAHPKLPVKVLDKTQTVQEAWLAARDSEADVDFDSDSLNPHISYLDEHNLQHDIWFLDGVTALNQMRAAEGLGIQTFALWRLGAEDRSLWRVWDVPGESSAPSKLSDVPPGQDVDMEGTGEILRIEAKPSNGQRTFTLDPNSGLITDETLDPLPEPYRVGRYGSSPNEMAITFDDGPDPEWTPKILDVLKREQAPATFFLIGIQADKYAGLTQRIYREGHTIGNHTFTHPDISNISSTYAKLELNLTEQLFASRLGIRTILFRPPYSVDAEPDTEDEVRPLESTQAMGYVTIGDKIDPNDWLRPPAAEISADVLAHLPPCALNDTRCGNIILLHDGGGDRSQTVLALPAIIEGIRAKGYQIVPLYQLMGKTRADIMPPIPANQRLAASLTWIGFGLFDVALKGIAWIFLIGDVLMTSRLVFVGAFAIFDRLRQSHFGTPAAEKAYQPLVAVLVPAYNEEKVIVRTVRSVLASDYPNLRVIVIDDGSRDETLEVTHHAFAAEEAAGRVLILTKPNFGKAEALDYGLKHLREEEIFVGIDADTVIAPNAISRLVPHFLNPKVGAVAGNAKVGNRVNLWTRWQALEYITSQNFERRALNVLGAVSVVPGALGAWRTSAVLEAGGYHADTVAEDADLTMALLRRGYRVEYEDLALAYTEAPINARGLMRQRFRWSFGILQSVWKHRGVFARKGVLGLVALPNIVIFQIILPLVSPLIDVMFVVGVLWYFVQKYFHPESTDPASIQRLILFFMAFLVIDFITSAIAFLLERRQPEAQEDGWLLSQVWLQRFAYRQLFSVVLFKTIIRAVEGKRFAWDKLERTADMSYRPSEQRDSVHVP